MQRAVAEYESYLEQRFSRIHNQIRNIRSKLPNHILSMTVGEMQELLEKKTIKTFEELNKLNTKNNAAMAEPANSRQNATLTNRALSVRPASRTDDGMYIFDKTKACILNWYICGFH